MVELCFSHRLFIVSHILTAWQSLIQCVLIWCPFIDFYHDPPKQSDSWYVDSWQYISFTYSWMVHCVISYFESSVIHELVNKFKDKLVILYHDHFSYMYLLILKVFFMIIWCHDNLLVSVLVSCFFVGGRTFKHFPYWRKYSSYNRLNFHYCCPYQMHEHRVS